MCGIAGKVGFSNTKKLSLETQNEDLNLMLNCIAHRGPDDSGLWSSQNGFVSLGHRRLSIIDISSRAKQPMNSNCSRFVCVFNGEIYNYIELRKELISKGFMFRTDSDTEVLIEMFSCLGIEETINKIDGMFAIALWDKKYEVLYLIRDRAGKKPLYYSQIKGSFTFASEVKALTFHQNKDLTFNANSAIDYFSLGYVPGNQTIYNEIKEVEPGSFLECSKKGIINKRYWSLNFNDYLDISYDEAIEETDHLLRKAVKKRLRSDVPLGFFLSGGIDSGLIVALAAELQGQNMSTYTVAFDDSSFDESDAARKVALQYNTNHTTLNAHIEPQEDILKAVDSYDEPFADPSAIPSMAVCKAASKELKVVLSGDGGDEIFGGYRRAMAAKLATDLNKYGVKIPNFLIKPLNFLAHSEDKYRSNLSFLNRFLSGLDKDPVNRYMIWAANGMGHQKDSAFNQEFTLAHNNSLLSFVDESQDVFQQLTCMDFSSQLPDALLVKMDIASMAHGLEVRSPFLDKDLTEFGLSIPMNIKLKNYKTKSILRSLASKYLPSQIFNSPKQGFEIPLVTWLQKDLASLVQDLFSNRNSIVYDIFNKKYIESLPENSQNLNLHQWANQLWIILMFRLWEERVHKK